MPSSEQQDAAAMATAPAGAAAPRATRSRSTLAGTRLEPLPSQEQHVDEALRRLDALRNEIFAAIGADPRSLAAPNLHGANGLLEETRRALANARALAR